MGARHAGRIEVVTQRGAHPADLVGCQLLALPTSAKDDAKIRVAIADGSANVRANQWIVAALSAMRAKIGDVVATRDEQWD